VNSNLGDFANDRSEAPRHSDELLRLLLDSAQEHAIFLLDRDGRVTWWSKGAERVFALPREQAIGMPLAAIFTATDEQSGLPDLEQAIARADAIAEDDRWHLRANGSRFWASGALITLRDPEGEVLGFGKILRDRTDIKEQLTASRNEVETVQRADAAKAQVISKVTHELRNLFAGMDAGLRLMHSNQSNKARQEQVIELMQQQLQVIRSLADELHDVQRIKAGKVTLAIQPTDVQRLLQNVLEHVRAHSESKSQTVQLLAPATPVVIAADPARLFQVFINLVENAIKYPRPRVVSGSKSLSTIVT
jgi:two-component system, chemotaxis family, CheB/CheR fusion protein